MDNFTIQGLTPGIERRARPLGWDIVLALLTAFTLMAFGVLCLFGMFYYKFQSVKPGWSVTSYQGMMNTLAAPLTILLILWLVLCIPKRLLARRALIFYSAAVVAVAAAAGLARGIIPALGVSLFLSGVLQALILVLVFTGARLRFSRRGLAVKVGSSLIHLGFVLLTLDLVAFQGSPLHIPIFWASTVFMTGGCALTFYFPRRR